MHFIASFLTTFSRSASEPGYYLSLIPQPFSRSLRFYLLLLLLLSVVDVAVFRLREMPNIITEADQITSQAIDSLPTTFTANYNSGKLEVKGVKLPYAVPSPKSARDSGFGNILLTLANEEKPAKDSFATLTSTQLILQGSVDIPLNTSGYALKDLFGDQHVSLDKALLDSKQQELIASLPQAANFFALAGIPLWFLGLVVATTLTLLFLTLFANSFAWLIGIHMPFIKTLQLGLHAIGVATAVDVLKYIIFPQAGVSLVIPAYLGIMGLVLWGLKSRIVEKHR